MEAVSKNALSQRKWYAKNKEKKRLYQRKWDVKNGIKNVAYWRKWAAENTERIMLNNAKKRGKDLGVPFDLTLDDIVIPDVCPVLGLWLAPGRGKPTGNSPSLDRIVPEKGYVVGNVIVVSHRANLLKNSATLAEMQALAAFYTKLEN